jgi:hypothetical protein
MMIDSDQLRPLLVGLLADLCSDRDARLARLEAAVAALSEQLDAEAKAAARARELTARADELDAKLDRLAGPPPGDLN